MADRTQTQTSAEPNGQTVDGVTETAGNGTQETETTESPTIETLWEVSQPTSSNGRHLHLEDGFIVGDPEGSYSRLNHDGTTQWSQNIDVDVSEGYISTRELIVGDILVLGGRSRLYGLDVDSGEIQWKTPIPTQEPTLQNTDTMMVASDDTVVSGYSYKLSDDEGGSGLFGIAASSGEIRWEKTHDTIAQSHDAWSGIQSLSPSIDGKTAVSGWNNDFWVEITSGEISGSSAPGGRFQPIRTDSHLYRMRTGNLAAHTIEGGSVTRDWGFEPLGRATTPPAVDSGVVYFLADDAGLYAVENGNQLWRVKIDPEIYPPPAVTDEAIWVAGENIYRVGKNGEPVVSVPAEGNSIQYTISSDGNVVYVTGTKATVAYQAE